MTQHTPGPWKLHEKEAQSYFCSEYTAIVRPREDGGHFAQIADVYGWRLPEGQANARLIAAAPDMADALIECCETCEKSGCGSCSIGRALSRAGISLPECWDGLWIRKSEK